MSLFRRPDFSDWRIAGSAGVDVQVETPVVNLSAGGGYLNLPLENTRTKEKITLHMGGVEVGLGIGESLFGIVDVEGSLSSFPSDGIGRIVRGPRSDGSIEKNDFVRNRAMIISVGYKVAAGWSLTAIAFIKQDFWTRVATAAIPGPSDDLIWSHAGGLFYGAGVGAGASVGVAYKEFMVLSVQ
ncbi:MAG: hypothetical protein H6712_21900 [Myxococcales bacterium]|nr:hypothetical protein [Myxococcales bacterium]MCB9716531.1 hypothetical protein [Myxococcales bacterium]